MKLDPTMVADEIADAMRVHYEENREGAWQRFWDKRRWGRYPNGLADNLMIGLLITAEREMAKVKAIEAEMGNRLTKNV